METLLREGLGRVGDRPTCPLGPGISGPQTSPAKQRDRVPESRRRLRRRFARVGEVPRLSAEGLLHAVRQVGVAPVEHLREEVDEQLDPVAWYALLVQSDAEVLGRHRQVAHLPARRLRDLVDGVGERQQAGAGQLVDLAHMAVVGQRGDRDVGDVVGVDERLGRVARRRPLRISGSLDYSPPPRGKPTLLIGVLVVVVVPMGLPSFCDCIARGGGPA